MAELARPFCYKHGHMSKYGIAYPFAPISHPFFIHPDPRFPRLSHEEQQNILHKLERLDIREHWKIDCSQRISLRGFTFPWDEWKDVREIPLLCVYLCHDTEDRQAYASSVKRGALKFGKCTHKPDIGCDFFADLAKMWVQDMTIRDVIFDLKYSPLLCYNYVRGISLVVVITSWSAVPGAWTIEQHCQDGYTRGEDDPLAFPCEDVTIIFWPAEYESLWVPLCTEGYDFSKECIIKDHVCQYQDRFWKELAKEAHDLESLTIVNASSVAPPGLSNGAHEDDLLCDRASAFPAYEYFERHFELEYERRIADNPWGMNGRRGFAKWLTLERWLKLNEWENVFSREEIWEYL